MPSLLTPWNQALSVAVQSAWPNTANAQTGQIFQNATTWPYTAQNAVNNGANITWYTSQATQTTPTATATPVQASPVSVTPSAPVNAVTPATQGVLSWWVATQKTTKSSLPSAGTSAVANNDIITAKNQEITAKNIAQIAANKAKRLPPAGTPWTTNPIPWTWATQTNNTAPGGTTATATTPLTDYYSTATAQNKESADKLMDEIDRAWVMSPELRNGIKNAYLSWDKATLDSYLAQNKLDATNLSNYISAYRTTRDANLQETQANAQTDLATQRATQQANQSIDAQKANIRQQQLANDMLMSTSGRGQSQNLTDTIHQELTNQQNILSNLEQSKSWALWEIASNAEYNHKILANNYNDQMSQYNYQLQDQIKSLSDTGLAKTAQGLSALQSSIEATNLKKLALSQTYASQLQFVSDQMKAQIAQKTPDKDQTNLLNDGYIHNSTGGIVYWPSGKPMVYNMQKKIESTVSDGNGGMIAIYSDWTHAPLYEGTPATPDQIDSYSKMVQQYGESALNLLPKNVQQQVMAYIGQKWLAPSNQSKYWVVWQHYDNNTGSMVNDYWFINETTGTIKKINWSLNWWDMSSLISKYPNEASFKNNNTAWVTVWMSDRTKWLLQNAWINFSVWSARPSSEGGNYVKFNSIEDGLMAHKILLSQAWSDDVNARLQQWVWTKEWPTYAYNLMAQAWIPSGAKFSQLSDDQLNSLVMAQVKKESPWMFNELTKWNTQPQVQKEYTQEQKNILNSIDPNSITKIDLSTLAQNSLTKNDVIQYKSNQKKDTWTSWLDDKQIQNANSIANSFYTSNEVTKFNNAQDAYQQAKALQNEKSNSADQAMIYAFAKAMDPNSAVKEGEYTTVQDYGQALADKIIWKIGRIYSTDWFLSQDAKDKMVKAIATNFSANQKTYENLRNTYAKRIDAQTHNWIWDRAIPSADIAQSQSEQKQEQAPSKQTYTKKDNPLDLNL